MSPSSPLIQVCLLLHRERAINVLEALLRISSRQFLQELNSTLDFSYLDTPTSGAPITCVCLCFWEKTAKEAEGGWCRRRLMTVVKGGSSQRT